MINPILKTTLADLVGNGGTQVLLMSAGERAMGEKGLDGVSLEEVAREAGQANKYAVQYHFGSREGLIQAIINHRLAAIEARRGQLLESVCPDCRRSIIAAFVCPLAEQVDTEGALSFAALLQRFALEQGRVPGVTHPVVDAPADSPTLVLYRMLCASLPAHSSRLVGRRLVTLMQLPLAFFSILTLEGLERRQEELDDILLMMDGALSAPPSEHSRN